MSIECKSSEKGGRGVFASCDFKKGEDVIPVHGELYPFSQLDKLWVQKDYYLQVESDLFIGSSGDIDDYINHSCEPNTGIIKKNGEWMVIAIKNITKGEEIAFDYSTYVDHDYSLECQCGTQTCRQTIGCFDNLPLELKKKYLDLGIVMPHLAKKFASSELKKSD